MIVCVCNAVTESEIRACVELGCTDLEAVREAVGVASCCGACSDCAREIIDSCRGVALEAQADAAPQASDDTVVAVKRNG